MKENRLMKGLLILIIVCPALVFGLPKLSTTLVKNKKAQKTKTHKRKREEKQSPSHIMRQKTMCQCFANGQKNETFCEGHGWDINRCLDPKNENRCHWGPIENPLCSEVPAHQKVMCQCFANGQQNETFCEGHGWDVIRCLDPKNKSRCHWGPTEYPQCVAQASRN